MKKRLMALFAAFVMLAAPLTGCSKSYEFDGRINEENFPDEVFREYISENFDVNGNGKLTEEEIAQAKVIDVSDLVVASLEGIEHFSALTSLNCGGAQIDEIDVGSNTNLVELNVSKCTALTTLRCDGTKIIELDVSQNTALTSLSCWGTKISALDVSKNIHLERLDCSNTLITEIDVSKNIGLKDLTCSGTLFTEIDVSKNVRLEWFDCADTLITELNVGQNTALISLSCFDSQITELDVSSCVHLESLWCDEDTIVIGLREGASLTGGKLKSEPEVVSSSAPESTSVVEKDDSQKIIDNAVGKPAIDVYNELEVLGYTVNFTHAVSKMDFTENVLTSSDPGDTEWYIPWIVTGVDSYDTNEKTASFFINTQEMIDEADNQSEAEDVLQAKLDSIDAWIAVEEYGSMEYPYGFKLRWIMGVLAETAVDENTWFLKAECEVKNANGIWEKNLVCEAHVTGTSESPQVIDFMVY